MRLLLDADALLALRKLSLWTSILASEIELVMTEYVAKHELSSIWSAELAALEARGRLVIEKVLAKPPDNPANKLRKALQARGADKGEAEAIAWAVVLDECSAIFVSNDALARRHAIKEKLRAVDLGDLAGLLVAEGELSEVVVADKIAVWDDVSQEQGRPKDWKGVDVSLPALVRKMKSP